jgi:hypothetical protein
MTLTTRERSPGQGALSTRWEADQASRERYQLEAVLDYAEYGLRVLPAGPDKRPRVQGGHKVATRNPGLLCDWWAKWPDANVGVATGDGLMVLDVDNHGGLTTGFESLAALGALPTTPVVTTPGGGLHFWFLGDGPSRTVAPGIDLKGRGGYVLAPPSRTKFGPYMWEIAPDETEPAPLPGLPSIWLEPPHAACAPARAADRIIEPGDPIREGQRHLSLRDVAVRLKRQEGAGFEEILAAIRSMNEARCVPPLGDEEVVGIAAWAAKSQSPLLKRRR